MTMKRLLVLSMLCLALFFGCEENNQDNTLNPGGGIGDTDTSLVSEFFTGEDIFDNPFKTLDVSMALLDSIPSTPAKASSDFRSLEGDDDVIITRILSYSYSEGWHIFSFEANSVSSLGYDTVYISGIDSVKFLLSSQPLQYPNSTEDFDEIVQHAHAFWNSSWGSDYGSVHHLFEVNKEIVSLDTFITINGIVNDTVAATEEDSTSNCSIGANLNQTITNLKLNVSDQAQNDCPISGSIISSTNLDIYCLSLDTANSFTIDMNMSIEITAVVNDDASITVTYTGNNVTWSSTTEPCGGVVTSSRQSPWFSYRD